MEPLLVTADLRRLGLGYSERDTRPTIGLRVDGEDRLIPLAFGDDVVPLIVGERLRLARLEPISALFRGDRRPPRFDAGPTAEYALFFHAIETTIADCATHLDPPPTDQEFEQLYRQLRRRPDAPPAAPLLSYMRAAVRLYMSLVDVSRAELEAVLNELGRSARRHATGHASRSYVTLLQDLFVEG